MAGRCRGNFPVFPPGERFSPTRVEVLKEREKNYQDQGPGEEMHCAVPSRPTVNLLQRGHAS